jgi:hypothetical protein
MIFGNLPLLGISYQGRERDEESKHKFSDKREMKKVMNAALRQGIRVFAASPPHFCELAPIYLEALEEVEREEEIDLELIMYVGTPLELKGKRLDDHKRWKTHLTFESKMFGKEIAARFFEDPILNCRTGWKSDLAMAKPYELEKLKSEMKINWKFWEESLNRLSEYNIAWIEPGSETDFLAISRIDLLGELLDRIQELGFRTLLGSHHLGISAPLITEEKLKRFEGYVTPINKMGVMMFPTQKRVEETVAGIKEEGKAIVSIKPLAGGRIDPKEALTYVYKKLKADSCMIGVGSVKEAEEDFQTARNILADTQQ